MPLIEPKEYRNAMARYAGHVQIVTTAHAGERRGVTITAACSVSDNPATVMICLNHSNPSNAIFEKAGIFALNSLAERHRFLADAFAGFTKQSAEERFALAEWESLVTGAPVLKDAIASYDCRISDTKRMSTHTVYFGEVVGLKVEEASPALVYLDRGYHSL